MAARGVFAVRPHGRFQNDAARRADALAYSFRAAAARAQPRRFGFRRGTRRRASGAGITAIVVEAPPHYHFTVRRARATG